MKAQADLAKIIKTKLELKKVRIGKYSLNYAQAGSGRPVLLLHGANIGWAQWYLNLADLAKQFKIYALDLPGAGASSKLDFYRSDLSRDFVDVVDQFVKQMKIRQLDIVGSSFGGWIALKLAIQHKPYIRKIVLSNPLGFTTFMPPKFRPVAIKPFAKLMSKTALRPVRSNKNLENFMRDVFFDKNQPLAPEFVDYFYELSKTSHNLLFISRLSSLGGMRKELFLKNELPLVKNPTLLIWGKEDPLMPFDSVEPNLQFLPKLKIKILPKVGHMPPVEAPRQFTDLTIKFLKA